MEQPSYWDLYPNEMLWDLLLELPFYDLLNICQTQKRAKDICDDDIFWKLKYRHDFNVAPSPPLIEINWRQQYIFDYLINKPTNTLLSICSRQPIFDHVCKNDTFWKMKYRKDFKVTTLPPLIEINWKQQYIFDSLLNLPIGTLLSICVSQKVFDHVCKNNLFWQTRYQKDFKNLPILTETNWKKQYLTDLVKFKCNFCNSPAVIQIMKQLRGADELPKIWRVCQQCGTKEII